MSKLAVGKSYSRKKQTYEIVSLGRMKLESNDWVESVGYRRVLQDGDEDTSINTTIVYTMSRKEFEELFIPKVLEVDDIIFAVSMGKKIGEYRVDSIDHINNLVYYKKISETKGQETDCGLITNNTIEFNGQIFEREPDKSISHINCVEYYFLSQNVKRKVKVKSKIDSIRGKLIEIYEAFGKIDCFSFKNIESLEYYDSQIDELINRYREEKILKL